MRYSLNLFVLLIFHIIFFVEALYAGGSVTSNLTTGYIGSYDCVASNTNMDYLVVISDLGIEERSIVSFVNKTNGYLYDRLVLEGSIEDVMLFDSNNLIIKYNETEFATVNASNGFGIESDVGPHFSENLKFVSSCFDANVAVEINGNLVTVEDKLQNRRLSNLVLPNDITDINYISTDFISKFEIMAVNKHNSSYVFLHLENDRLIPKWWRDESNSNPQDFCLINVDNISKSSQVISGRNGTNWILSYWVRLKSNLFKIMTFMKAYHFSIGKLLTEKLVFNSNLYWCDRSNKQNQEVFGPNRNLILFTRTNQLKMFDNIYPDRVVWCIDVCPMHNRSFLKMEWLPKNRELVLFSKDGFYIVYHFSDKVTLPVVIKEDTFGCNCEIASIKKYESNHDSEGKFYLNYSSKCAINDIVVDLFDTTQSVENTLFTKHNSSGIYGQRSDNEGALRQTWQISLDEDFERLIAFSSRSKILTISQSEITDSGKTLHKYLYPNLACYIVLDTVTLQLSVNIIDTVTGEILATKLHNKEHIDIDYDVNVEFGENWVIYSYFSLEPIPEQKLGIIELFEPQEKIPKNVKSNKLNVAGKPILRSSSFCFPEVITNIGTSSTKFDITIKALVLEIANGQMAFIPKPFLHTLRKREAGLNEMYRLETDISVGSILLKDYFIITKSDKFLFGNTSVLSTYSTDVESTSIVCDVGHDVFCTRLLPSGQYDTMKSDFKSTELIVSCLLCVLSCLFLKPMLETKISVNRWLVRS